MDVPRMITVAVVEDDRGAREAICAVIDATDGFVLRGAYASAEEAITALPDAEPDAVLMDIQLPGLSGIECVRKLKDQLLDTDFIMLTAMDDEESVFRSLGAGATGYLHKHATPQEILDAIREVRGGGSVISPGIARLLVRSFQPKSEPGLSDRETEVLARLCNGENYRSIADALFISTNTVKAHIKSIYVKLHVHTRAEAVRLAMRDRLV
ncbi:MAG TPA: response regulator transcription factor [Flavobacteriales bacterium]|nr:response regulator transcription factor [Flavobacteriales bacterium]HMR26135.1 response regulator transcription factor [Flavobacteriales bacterium]